MYGVFLENRIELLDLHPIWSVLAVLRRNITRSAGHACAFVLSAFQNDLDTVAF